MPTLHGGDTFYGSLPDGDPFGGTVMERHEGRAIVEVNQKRYHLHKAQPHENQRRRLDQAAARILGHRLRLT